MINGIFYLMMNTIGCILKFIIVFGILGFLFLLPFLLKGGWILGVVIYGFLILSFVTAADNSNKEVKDSFEKKMKERENNANKN